MKTDKESIKDSAAVILGMFLQALILWLLWNHAVIKQFPNLPHLLYWFVFFIIIALRTIRYHFKLKS